MIYVVSDHSNALQISSSGAGPPDARPVFEWLPLSVAVMLQLHIFNVDVLLLGSHMTTPQKSVTVLCCCCQ